MADLAAPLPSLAGLFVGGLELTTQRNVALFDEIALRQHVMVDFSHRDLSIEVLGQTIMLTVKRPPTVCA